MDGIRQQQEEMKKQMEDAINNPAKSFEVQLLEKMQELRVMVETRQHKVNRFYGSISQKFFKE
jgi:hypothetical protein